MHTAHMQVIIKNIYGYLVWYPVIRYIDRVFFFIIAIVSRHYDIKISQIPVGSTARIF